MHTRKLAFGTLFLCAVVLTTGCISINGHGWHWGLSVWTEEVQERIALDTADLEKLQVKTHNGFVYFTADSGEAYVTVTKKTAGWTADEAEKAMEALEVFVEPAGAGTQKLGYRWKGLKAPSWNASVSFDIHAPGGIDLAGQTHNGQVKVVALQGDLEFKTHNGEISATTSGEVMAVRTHNGGIKATFAGKQLDLRTHNGSVTADLTACAGVEGKIETHNGGVDILVGEATSLNLDCRTHNGGIRCTVPLESVETTRRTLHGKLGSGGGNLVVQTHNGDVRVKDSAG